MFGVNCAFCVLKHTKSEELSYLFGADFKDFTLK